MVIIGFSPKDINYKIMTIKTIKIEKSRTIHVENIRGRDLFNKLTMAEEVELKDTDNEEEVRRQVSANIDNFFEEEIKKIKSHNKDKQPKF